MIPPQADEPTARRTAGLRPKSGLSPFLRIALPLGLCLHLAGFLIFRVVMEPLPEDLPAGAFLQFVPSEGLLSSDALEEQALLFDSAPLFVPGRWNAAHGLAVPLRDPALDRFPLYVPEIDLAGQLRPESLVLNETHSVRTPADLLALRYWDLFSGFGRSHVPIQPLPESTSFAEVRDVLGRLRATLPVTLEGGWSQLVGPARFLLRMEARGRRSGPPVLEESSGDAAFDALAEGWLRRAGSTSTLPSGLLEIRIYP